MSNHDNSRSVVGNKSLLYILGCIVAGAVWLFTNIDISFKLLITGLIATAIVHDMAKPARTDYTE